MSNYHVPVMLQECLEALNIQTGGIFVDVTFGGGGHSRAILNRLDEKGRLIAFDQDDDALANIPDDSRFELAHHNFRFLKKFLRYYEATQVDGLLADLGISSHQIDEAERGFAHRFDADLDMRMNRDAEQSAFEWINNSSVDTMQKVFKEYGELRNAGAVARGIESSRAQSPIRTTGDLKKAITRFATRGKENQFYSQVFQAIRIEVNGELDALRELLMQCVDAIKPGGRLVVMSYHSLEDRLVKNFIQTGDFSGKATKDLYGNVIRPFTPLGKAIKASDEEIVINPRARSARLRIAERA